MTTVDGDLALPQNDLTASSTASGKRKRSESVDIVSSSTTRQESKQFSGFSRRLQNALPLLRKADQAPSILHYSLTSNGERSPKRPKYSSENAEAETISSRIESGYYHSPEILLADVETAATSLIEGLKSGDHALTDSDFTRKAANQVTLFKQSLSKVCRHIVEADAKPKEENGVDKTHVPGPAAEIPNPAVLTLTSQTDRGPKHLYTGLQRYSTAVPTDTDKSNSNQSTDLLNLKPSSFPNGITLTHIPPSNIPYQSSSAKQKRVFGEVFRPHRSLKALEPPRPSRNATRGSSLGWVNYEEIAGSERPAPAYKSDYRYASLPTGSWLHYNSVEAAAAAALTPDSKRRQRDRALSSGESRGPDGGDIVEQEEARTKALFQSAYSTFAPSVDNSAAVVPEKTRSQTWWKKVGQKRFEAMLAFQYPESGLDGGDSIWNKIDPVEDDFEGAVADFDGDALRNPLENENSKADSKDVDEVLQEISDLLQTLSSYQRIRNLSKMNSGPATPTSTETDVYEILRSNLAILINSLPPYAVAKLSGDQLATLNVSSDLILEVKDHVGTMEQDEYSMQRQRAAMPATHSASGRSSVSVGPSGRPGNYSAQAVNYNQRVNYSNGPRTPYVSQPRPIPAYTNTVTPQAQNYSAARPAQTPSHRASLPTQQHHQGQTYSRAPSAAQFQRPASSQQNGYGPSYAQTVNSQAYAQQRQAQSTYSYSLNQASHKPSPSPQPAPHTQQSYIPPQHLQQSQASPSLPYAVNNQAVLTEQARSQLQAQRQLSGTPQTPNINGQYAQMARSSTPGGGTQNGRRVVAAGGGVQ
ncbi:hypothetical protein EPUS_07040 [Endocarpon pusillum Z07020]|uniref:Uncharacterized protein n=1 Tax=Endocarpon pusillum (strain Z07020 / HMAS-L-300199) TaxID=1263415 RepID=U1HLB9_ENDPU|nr:uncharacterized protein EPUS_07040 [Endocarpon pusillum Z07020]ERF69784.1 hypothetical protein EPUS_07040 [Endocarpon pusillum Z07020]